jgi:hypothetical protein
MGATLAALTAVVVSQADAGQAAAGGAETKLLAGATAATKAPAGDARAEQLLKQMSDYLAGLRQFRVRSSSTDEIVTTSGQKVQVAADSDVTVHRPNALTSAQVGSTEGLAFYYDGRAMSLYCKMDNSYGTVKAPPTIDATLDELDKKYGIDAPGADLLYSNAYDVLTEQVKGGQYLGLETIDAVPAHHLAFQGDKIDVQVWIKDGSEPLPLRYVITTKTMKTYPQFTVQLSHWEPQAAVSDSAFKLEPPSGATHLDSLPTKCGSKTSTPERK